MRPLVVVADSKQPSHDFAPRFDVFGRPAPAGWLVRLSADTADSSAALNAEHGHNDRHHENDPSLFAHGLSTSFHNPFTPLRRLSDRQNIFGPTGARSALVRVSDRPPSPMSPLRTFTKFLGRGVFVAPWCGPDGEIVLVAITSRNRIVGDPLIVPLGGDHLGVSDELWRRLEAAEPSPLQLVL
jgi:hypothetical protein